MKAKMYYDGVQRVDVPIEKALDLAKEDEYNRLMIKQIERTILRKGKITKGDLDYINDYIKRKDGLNDTIA